MLNRINDKLLILVVLLALGLGWYYHTQAVKQIVIADSARDSLALAKRDIASLRDSITSIDDVASRFDSILEARLVSYNVKLDSIRLVNNSTIANLASTLNENQRIQLDSIVSNYNEIITVKDNRILDLTEQVLQRDRQLEFRDDLIERQEALNKNMETIMRDALKKAESKDFTKDVIVAILTTVTIIVADK